MEKVKRSQVYIHTARYADLLFSNVINNVDPLKLICIEIKTGCSHSWFIFIGLLLWSCIYWFCLSVPGISASVAQLLLKCQVMSLFSTQEVFILSQFVTVVFRLISLIEKQVFREFQLGRPRSRITTLV